MVDITNCSQCKFVQKSLTEYPCSQCTTEDSKFVFRTSQEDFQANACCENREWNTGAKRDPNNGKGRMDLLPWTAIMEVSKLCQKGAEHYGEHNVDKGIPMSSLCDSGARHLAKFIDGWCDEDHLVSAAWNILWAIQMRAKKPEMIDVPWEDKK